MAKSSWLTQEELLTELEQAGIKLPERTLRFWVSHGVVPPAVKKPFRGADGRVGYYRRETVGLVPRVLELQEQGWKLRQIKERLEGPDKPERSSRPPAPASEESYEIATRYLRDLMSDSQSNDRRRYFFSSGAASSELRQVRHYLVARLERLVGRAVAVRATSAFLLDLDAKETRKLLARLRVRSGLRQSTAKPGDDVDPELLKEHLTSPPEGGVARHLSQLQPWLEQPAPPLLLRRTYDTLSRIQRLLERANPGDAEELSRELHQLHEIERQAAGNLAYLARLSPAEDSAPSQGGHRSEGEEKPTRN